ncbi:MAG: GMP/IMP nucleotidase [Porticoccaceae bacterium]
MINWRAIDTVLLDMDGTLLDLHFDNYFWITYLPRRYAEYHGLCPDKATADLHRIFHEKRGTLEWYCLDYWSRELAVDIRALKEEIQHLIGERPHAMTFLKALKAAGKQRCLITNAHPRSLSLKLSLTGIGSELDTIISSHELGHPKEAPAFWEALRSTIAFDPARSLFIDDSLSVLGAAQRYGIGHIFAIAQPDSQRAPVDTSPFPAIRHFDEVLPEALEYACG